MAEGKRLGCKMPTAYIQTVGGNERLAELRLSSISYRRALDEISECRIQLAAAQDAQCIRVLNELEAWEHEIGVFRDVYESWSGPVTEASYTYVDAAITARDMFEWFERRILPRDRSFANTDLATIAVAYLTDALAVDNSMGISFFANPCGILGNRAVLGVTKRRAADEVREICRGGLDFTTIGRQVRFGGKEIATSRLPTLTADIFEIAPFRIAGLQKANHVFVLGATPAGVTTPLVGEAGGSEFPVVQQTYSEPSVLDVTSANAAAATRWDLLHDSPQYITGRFLEDAPIATEDLIPGAITTIRQQVGFRSVDADFRLMAVEFSNEFSDSGFTERVSGVFQPVGTLEG